MNAVLMNGDTAISLVITMEEAQFLSRLSGGAQAPMLTMTKRLFLSRLSGGALDGIQR